MGIRNIEGCINTKVPFDFKKINEEKNYELVYKKKMSGKK